MRHISNLICQLSGPQNYCCGYKYDDAAARGGISDVHDGEDDDESTVT